MRLKVFGGSEAVGESILDLKNKIFKKKKKKYRPMILKTNEIKDFGQLPPDCHH